MEQISAKAAMAEEPPTENEHYLGEPHLPQGAPTCPNPVQWVPPLEHC